MSPSNPAVSFYSFQFVNDAEGSNCNATAVIMFKEPAADRPGQVTDLIDFSATLEYLNPAYGPPLTAGFLTTDPNSTGYFVGATWNASGISSLDLLYPSDAGQVIVTANQISIGPEAVALGQWAFLEKFTITYPLHKAPGH